MNADCTDSSLSEGSHLLTPSPPQVKPEVHVDVKEPTHFYKKS